jgi:transposase
MHANSRSTTAGFRSNGAATEASGPIVRGWQDDPGRDCPRIAGKPPERKSLVQAMEAWRWRSTARRRPSGSQTEVGTTATATCRGCTAKGSKGPRFWHKFVDTPSRSCCCRALDRRALSSGTCVEDTRIDGLDTAATSQASPGAQSGGSEALGRTKMAQGKKNARRRKAWIFFQDESGVSQRPSIRRTWAPKGETPVLIHAFNWSTISVCAAMGFRWDGRRSQLFFQTREGSYNSESLIAFLQDLRRHLRGKKAVLVWDGLPAHKSQAMMEYLHSQRSWLSIERLPGYAPDLNPVETLWGNVKGQELANRCSKDLDEVVTAVESGFKRVRKSRTLPFSFLKHAGLIF